MEHLADISVEDIRDALASIDGHKPARRLFAALAYKQGITQSELAEWFDVERKTIYNWLSRLESGDLESAVRDKRRPGRPRKLTAEQLSELKTTLRTPPPNREIDQPFWTTTLVRVLIRERYDVEYSLPSCRRLMKELGLTSRTSEEALAIADPDDPARFERHIRRLGRVWSPRTAS